MAQLQTKEIKKQEEPKELESLVRILGYDIPGTKSILVGLTRIKGVSWAISNAACIKLAFQKNIKISELSKQQIQEIEKFLKELQVPDYLKNRRKDPETGETSHFYGTDLELKRDFDIKRLKQIKSYKGIRHSAKQPVRGQRTRSHFRKRGGAVGVARSKVKQETKEAKAGAKK